MKEITIKIFVDGKEVSGNGSVDAAAVRPQLEEEQRQNLTAALNEVQRVLDNHGKNLNKPIPPINLMALKNKLERVLDG